MGPRSGPVRSRPDHTELLIVIHPRFFKPRTTAHWNITTCWFCNDRTVSRLLENFVIFDNQQRCPKMCEQVIFIFISLFLELFISLSSEELSQSKRNNWHVSRYHAKLGFNFSTVSVFVKFITKCRKTFKSRCTYGFAWFCSCLQNA